MNVYSGECEHGKCGTITPLKDNAGETLCVGDIVMVSSQNIVGGPWHHGLSVVVENRPGLTGGAPAPAFFVMGIVSVDIGKDEQWIITRAKRWNEVVEGEHWKSYGFNYRMPNNGGEVRRDAVTSTGLLADESKGETK